MNALDELLSSTARVDDMTPAALHNNRAALESAIANLGQARSPAPRPLHRPADRPRTSKRGMFIAASVAAAAAVVAATMVSVLPGHSGGGHPSGSQAAGGGASSNVGINLTAAIVLRNAGKAAGEQQGAGRTRPTGP